MWGLRDWIVMQIRANPERCWRIITGLDFQPDGPSRVKASCPFHDDRTPSFKVSTYNRFPGRFKCFSCGRSGDIFSFLEDLYSLNFIEAVQRACELLKGGG